MSSVVVLFQFERTSPVSYWFIVRWSKVDLVQFSWYYCLYFLEEKYFEICRL